MMIFFNTWGYGTFPRETHEINALLESHRSSCKVNDQVGLNIQVSFFRKYIYFFFKRS